MELSKGGKSTLKNISTQLHLPDCLNSENQVAINSCDSAFERLQVRYLILGFPVILLLPFLFVSTSESPALLAFRHLIYLFLMALMLFCFSKIHDIEIKRLFRTSKQKLNFQRLTISYVFPLVCFALASAWLVFYPLTFIWPESIEALFTSSFKVVHWAEGEFLWGLNTIYLLILCVFYPCVEELLFRGYLLNRWAKKWSVQKAAILSSVLFGLLHPNVLGAVFFGYVLCILYIQTKNLWIPIIVHGLNNGIAWLFEFADTFGGKAGQMYLDFMQNVWVGVICFVLSGFWLANYLCSHHSNTRWEAPYD